MDGGGFVDEIEPGLELVYTLLSMHSEDDLPFEAHIAAVAGWERIISWATAMQAEQLVAIDVEADVKQYGWNAADAARSLCDRIGLAMGVSGGSAARRMSTAVTAMEKVPAVHDALKRGAITTQHARFATAGALNLPVPVAQQAAATTMVGEDWRTPQQFGDVFARNVIALDPDGAEERNRQARKGRRVSKRNEPDGMASFYATLLAEDCAAIYDRIDASARSSLATNVPGDERTLDSRRADALVQIVLGQISNGYDGPAVHDPACPAHPASDGCDTMSDAGRTGPRSTTGTAPGAAEAANAPDVDVDVDDAAGTPDSADTGGAPGGTETVDANAACTCGDKPVAPSEPTRHGRKATIHVTVSWSTLIGLDHRPAHLTGYGAIDAATARRIAADPTSTWYRLLVDPVSGTLLDHGRTKYRPPQDLQDFVIARDRCCRFPNCETVAAACDLDHRQDWEHGGTTCADCLDCLCRRHHLLKHQGGWTHQRDPVTGDSTWTDPSGTTHRRPATVLPTPEPVEPPLTAVPEPEPEPAPQLVEVGPPPF